jgi:hypothetical protein
MLAKIYVLSSTLFRAHSPGRSWEHSNNHSLMLVSWISWGEKAQTQVLRLYGQCCLEEHAGTAALLMTLVSKTTHSTSGPRTAAERNSGRQRCLQHCRCSVEGPTEHAEIREFSHLALLPRPGRKRQNENSSGNLKWHFILPICSQ